MRLIELHDSNKYKTGVTPKENKGKHYNGSEIMSLGHQRSPMTQVAQTEVPSHDTISQGLWQFKVLPFGLCNGPATFERFMERVLVGMPRSCCIVYLDDILCHVTSFPGALESLGKVFNAISGAGLKLHPKKCHLLRRQTGFLGHVVGAAGMATDPAKVDTVKSCPVPRDVAELRSFLGLASYYRRFIRDLLRLPAHCTS